MSKPLLGASNWEKLRASLGQSRKYEQTVDSLKPWTKRRRLCLEAQKSLDGIAAEKRQHTLSLFDDSCQSHDNHQSHNSCQSHLNMPHSAGSVVGASADGSSITQALAMDCEMVGVGNGGVDSILARVSIVSQHSEYVYDKYVLPRERVTDFRTPVSGIRPGNLKGAVDFLTVQKEVYDLLKGRILVGHALRNDLQVLFLDHPRRDTRDTSRYKPFRQLTNGRTPSLKKLAASMLGVDIQQGEHDSVEDAQTAMQLYLLHRRKWEQGVKQGARRWRRAEGREESFRRKKKKESRKTVHFALNPDENVAA